MILCSVVVLIKLSFVIICLHTLSEQLILYTRSKHLLKDLIMICFGIVLVQ
jgi:hypothetical protein